MVDQPNTTAPVTEPVAKPWYLSKTILSLLAGIVLALTPKISLLLSKWFGLPAIQVTQDQANMIATIAVTQGIALYSRIQATHVITATAAKAKALNAAASK